MNPREPFGSYVDSRPRYVSDEEAAKLSEGEYLYYGEDRVPRYIVQDRLLATRKALLEALIEEHGINITNDDCDICALIARVRKGE